MAPITCYDSAVGGRRICQFSDCLRRKCKSTSCERNKDSSTLIRFGEQAVNMNCGRPINVCDSNPCLHMLHGQCVETGDGFTCDCDTGWIGPRCDLDSSQWTCSESTARCYHHSPSQYDYDNALAYCSSLNPVSPLTETKNTSMLFVSTGAEIEEVKELLGITATLYIWVNCNDRVVEGDFVCVIDTIGTTTPARNWRSNQPGGGLSQQCVAVETGHTQWEDKSCTDVYDTVCQIHLVPVAEVDPCESNPCQNGECVSSPGAFACRCDAGWSGEICDKEWKCTATKCYLLLPETNTFNDAVAYCDSVSPVTLNETIANGTRNASILFVGSDADISEVEGLFDFFSSSRYVWVNCYDDNSDESFDCTLDDEGTLTDIRNWRYDQPNGGGSQDCVAVLTSDNKWQDKRCTESHYTVCQVYRTPIADIDECAGNPCQNGVCTDGLGVFTCTCDDGWKGDMCEILVEWKCTATKCFHLRTETSTFDDAVAYCDSLSPVTLNETIANGTRNASILFVGSDTEINEVGGLFDFLSSSHYVWINCYDENSDESFVCTLDDEGTLTDIRNWRYDQPNGNGNQNCMAVYIKDSKWQDKGCTETYYTVCQIYRTPIADIDECASNPCQNGVCTDGVGMYTCTCDDGWTGDMCQVLVEWKCTATKCFHVYTETQIFNDAAAYCDSLNPVTLNETIVIGSRNASVLFVGSDAAIEEVEDLFDFFSSNRHVWVNCYDENSDADFVCTADDEGALTNIRHWRYDQPNGGGSQDCVAVLTSDNKWQDKRCTETYYTVCQIYRVPVEDIDECATNPCVNGICVDGVAGFTCTCNNGWIGYLCDQAVEWECSSTKCYHMNPNQQVFEDALNYCSGLSPVSLNATITRESSLLFVVTDAEIIEVETLLGISSDLYIWVNCNDRKTDGQFECFPDEQGLPTNDTNWLPGQPNGGTSQDCVAVEEDNKWQDKECDNLYNTVCQIVI